MAIRKGRHGSKKDKNGRNAQAKSYSFDVEKCKCCSFKDGCYKEGATTLFLVNMKRIILLNEEKAKDIE